MPEQTGHVPDVQGACYSVVLHGQHGHTAYVNLPPGGWYMHESAIVRAPGYPTEHNGIALDDDFLKGEVQIRESSQIGEDNLALALGAMHRVRLTNVYPFIVRRIIPHYLLN